MKTLKVLVALFIIVACTVYSVSKTTEIIADANYKYAILEIEKAFDHEEINDDQYYYLLEIANFLDKSDVLKALKKEKTGCVKTAPLIIGATNKISRPRSYNVLYSVLLKISPPVREDATDTYE
jgi:hypothetical protein